MRALDSLLSPAGGIHCHEMFELTLVSLQELPVIQLTTSLQATSMWLWRAARSKSMCSLQSTLNRHRTEAH